jgi:very-short-patch-repair endonuclease
MSETPSVTESAGRELLIGVVGSPLELAFADAFIRVGGAFMLHPRPGKNTAPVIGRVGDVTLFVQQPIERYRADFWLTVNCAEGGNVVVEIDGHEWHERTPEQAARDKRRDRVIASVLRCPVLRFTGREMHRDPDACLAECIETARDLVIG